MSETVPIILSSEENADKSENIHEVAPEGTKNKRSFSLYHEGPAIIGEKKIQFDVSSQSRYHQDAPRNHRRASVGILSNYRSGTLLTVPDDPLMCGSESMWPQPEDDELEASDEDEETNIPERRKGLLPLSVVKRRRRTLSLSTAGQPIDTFGTTPRQSGEGAYVSRPGHHQRLMVDELDYRRRRYSLQRIPPEHEVCILERSPPPGTTTDEKEPSSTQTPDVLIDQFHKISM